MNVFPWNFQDRSDMSQGTIGSIVDGSDLVRLFHDSLATRGGGLRSRIASCFISCTLCNWYSSHVDFFSFYVSFAVINSPLNRGIYIISACEMVNRSYRKWLAGFWPRRLRWNNVQSQFVDSTVFFYTISKYCMGCDHLNQGRYSSWVVSLVGMHHMVREFWLKHACLSVICIWKCQLSRLVTLFWPPSGRPRGRKWTCWCNGR